MKSKNYCMCEQRRSHVVTHSEGRCYWVNLCVTIAVTITNQSTNHVPWRFFFFLQNNHITHNLHYFLIPEIQTETHHSYQTRFCSQCFLAFLKVNICIKILERLRRMWYNTRWQSWKWTLQTVLKKIEGTPQ